MGSTGSKAARGVSMAGGGVKQLILSKVENEPVVVFSKSYCPYCHKAKEALLSLLSKDKIVIEELDQRADGGEIQDALAEITGGRSVPRVFIGGKFIGGGDDTVRLKQTGELQSMLKAAGAL